MRAIVATVASHTGELLPELQFQDGPLTPKLEKLVHTLEWVRIEEFGSPPE